MTDMPNEKEEFLKVPDIMRIFRVSRRTVYYWIERKLLRPIDVRGVQRFRPEDVEELCGAQKRGSFKRKKRILAIDDDILVRSSLKPMLERFGFSVMVVSNGKDAVKFASRMRFDLVITDLRMPGMNGIETLKAIREARVKSGLPPVREIILTAYDEQSAKEEAKRMGVDEFVMKPFELRDFLAIVRRLTHEELKVLQATTQEQNTPETLS